MCAGAAVSEGTRALLRLFPKAQPFLWIVWHKGRHVWQTSLRGGVAFMWVDGLGFAVMITIFMAVVDI